MSRRPGTRRQTQGKAAGGRAATKDRTPDAAAPVRRAFSGWGIPPTGIFPTGPGQVSSGRRFPGRCPRQAFLRTLPCRHSRRARSRRAGTPAAPSPTTPSPAGSPSTGSPSTGSPPPAAARTQRHYPDKKAILPTKGRIAFFIWPGAIGTNRRDKGQTPRQGEILRLRPTVIRTVRT